MAANNIKRRDRHTHTKRWYFLKRQYFKKKIHFDGIMAYTWLLVETGRCIQPNLLRCLFLFLETCRQNVRYGDTINTCARMISKELAVRSFFLLLFHFYLITFWVYTIVGTAPLSFFMINPYWFPVCSQFRRVCAGQTEPLFAGSSDRAHTHTLCLHSEIRLVSRNLAIYNAFFFPFYRYI